MRMFWEHHEAEMEQLVGKHSRAMEKTREFS
jgi:hypothetical protein